MLTNEPLAIRLASWARAFLALIVGLFLALPSMAGTCFAIDDDSNVIITYDSTAPLNVRFTTTIPSFGATTNLIEAAYFDSVTNRYYVVRQSAPNQFGYVRPNDGAYIAVGTSLGVTSVPTARTIGTGNTGNNRIVGLTRNPIDNKWYVIDRDGFIYEINPVTGSFVPGSFGGNDYLRVLTPIGGVVAAVEDFAFDNAGNLFVVQNGPSANQFLRNINLITGLASSALNLGVTEAEGLSNSLGDIRLIIGGSQAPGAPYVRSDFLSVDTATGALTRLFTVPNPAAGQADFEATGCNDGVPRADLKLSKTVAPAAVAPGVTASFTLRVEHEGIDIAHRIQVQETLPAGMSVISSTQGPGCGLCSYDIPSNVWSIDKMDIGQVRTVTLIVSTAGVVPNSFVDNRAQISQVCQAATGPCVPLIDVDSTPANKAGSSWSPTEDDEAIAGLLVTAQPSVAKAFSPSTGLAGQTSLLVLTFNNPNASSIATTTAVFTDTYPVGMLNAATPAAATTCAGTGAITALAGGSSISLGAGRVIPAGGSCSLSVVVTASSVGNYTNTVNLNALTVTVAGTTVSNVIGSTAIYRVSPDNVGVIKDFTPDGIGAGQTSTLKLTLSNPRNVTATLLTNFVDNYPSNLLNATTPNPQTNCTGGVVTAVAGGSSLSLAAGAQIAPGSSCTITVVVTSSVIGLYTNTIPAGSLSTSVGLNFGQAASTLLVDNPGVQKVFVPASIEPGQNSVLRLTFTNPRNTTATFTSNFVDIYPSIPAGTVVNAATPGVVNGCGGGATATAGSNQISLNTANVIAPFSSCVFTVNVTTNPATATGTFVNTVPAGSLTTNLGNSTTPATATLTVSAQTNLSVSKVVSSANIFPGTTLTYTVTISNLGPSSAINAQFTDIAQGVNLIAPFTSTFSAGASIGSITTSSSNITATLTIPNGGFITLTFRGQPTVANGFITNTASVQSGVTATDNVLSNNAASVNTQISPSVNLSISKTNGTNTVPAGGTTVYTVTFSNFGPSDASGALVKDFPSAGLTFCLVQSCSGTGGAICGAPTFTALNTSGYSLPVFPSGSTISLVLSCRVDSLGL
jgi:uncharacterized repeat protein (TIGR01451 family)